MVEHVIYEHSMDATCTICFHHQLTQKNRKSSNCRIERQWDRNRSSLLLARLASVIVRTYQMVKGDGMVKSNQESGSGSSVAAIQYKPWPGLYDSTNAMFQTRSLPFLNCVWRWCSQLKLPKICPSLLRQNTALFTRTEIRQTDRHGCINLPL